MSDPYGIYVDHDETQASSFTSFQIVLALTNSHIFWKIPRVCTAPLFRFCSGLCGTQRLERMDWSTFPI